MALATDVAALVEPLQRMALHLSHAQGSAVLLATTPDADLARELAEELTRRLAASHVVRSFHFAPDRLNLPAFLRTLPLPDSERRSVVFGFGLDDLPEVDRKRAMDELNLGRETLRWTGHSVVLWLRPPTVQQVTFQAPDFFAVRSGLFDFTALTDGADREETLRALNVNGAATLPDLRQRYLDYVISLYRWLDFRGLMQVRNLVRLPLKDVFVPLWAEREQARRELRELKELRELRELKELKEEKESSGEFPEFLEFPAHEKQRVELANALRENARLVVLGDPGSGKSTLLKHLALAFAEGETAVRERLKLDETRLPILVPISAYALALRGKDEGDRVGAGLAPAEGDHKGRALLDFLPQHFESLGLPNLGPLFEQALEAGEAIILLDGLDEVLDAEPRALVARQAEALAAAYPRCRFVVTSRIAGYSSTALGSGFATITIRPFERGEIERFAQQWSRAYEALNVEEGRSDLHGRPLPPEAELRTNARAKSLTEAIFANPAIERLATTPLLLTLLALIHHTGTRLPTRRVELYRLCVEALAETWNLARSQSGQPIELWLGERRLDEREVVRLLAPVAFHMHTHQPGGLIPRAELEALIADQLRDDHGERAPALAHQFVELVREQVGLMLERGPDLFGFMHLTFEEYLAARHLAAKRDPFPLLKPRLHAPRWREVILLTAASLEGERATDFVRAIYNANSPLNDILHLDLFLAARCLADDVRVEPAQRRELVSKVVNFALRGRFEKLREEARNFIAALRDTASEHDATQALLAALRDEDWSVRGSAAWALGQTRVTTDAVVSALLGALRDEKAGVRGSAAGALGQLGQASEAVMVALLAALRDEKAGVRESAAEALGRIGQVSETLVSTLLAVVRDESESVEMHESAVEALGQLGQAPEPVVAALLAALRDKYPDVRESAAEALGRIGQVSEALVAMLLAAVRDKKESVEVRNSAVEALGRLGQTSEAAVAALLIVLQDKKEEGFVRWRAAEALGQTGVASEAMVAALLAAVRDKSESVEVRESAARALGWLSQTSEPVVEVLLAALRDEDWQVRAGAAEALGRLGQASEPIVAALLSALQNKYEVVAVCWRVAMALGQIGQASETIVAVLLAALRDEGWQVRAWAAEALGRLGQPSNEIIHVLREHLDDGWFVSESAFTALRQLAPKMYEEGAAMVSTDEKRING